jgi:2-methylcitrate dehydratase PrpD
MQQQQQQQQQQYAAAAVCSSSMQLSQEQLLRAQSFAVSQHLPVLAIMTVSC